MDQLIPGLAALVAPLRDRFRVEVFQTSRVLIAGRIVCLKPHTRRAVWQATGLAAQRHHDTAYAVSHSAAWDWDDLGIVLATSILSHLVPGGVVRIAGDDTLCHNRGAKVAYGGISLDPVLSSKRHKTSRFGLNRVVLGIAVLVPFRHDRYFCLPVLWRLRRKKGQSGYRPRPQAAAVLPANWPRLIPSGPPGWSATAPTSTRRCCGTGRRTFRCKRPRPGLPCRTHLIIPTA